MTIAFIVEKAELLLAKEQILARLKPGKPIQIDRASQGVASYAFEAALHQLVSSGEALTYWSGPLGRERLYLALTEGFKPDNTSMRQIRASRKVIKANGWGISSIQFAYNIRKERKRKEDEARQRLNDAVGVQKQRAWIALQLEKERFLMSLVRKWRDIKAGADYAIGIRAENFTGDEHAAYIAQQAGQLHVQRDTFFNTEYRRVYNEALPKNFMAEFFG